MSTDLLASLAHLSAAQKSALKARFALPMQEDGLRIATRADRSAYPLSFAQEALWLIDQIESGAHYNDYAAFRIQGELDVSILKRALHGVVSRHESLRATFPERDGAPHQVISPMSDVLLPEIDLSNAPVEEVWHAARKEAQAPFDLARGPLFRVKLIRHSRNDHVLSVTMHHIVTDGWSMGVFIQEMSAFYAALRSGNAALAPGPLAIQYADYAAWQRQRFHGSRLEQELAYWRKQLSDSKRTEFPRDRQGDPLDYSGARFYVALPMPQLARLKELARLESVSLYMVLAAALNILMAKYSGQTDILLGCPVAGRDQVETHSLIGVFINTLVFRTQLSADPTIGEILTRVRDTALAGFAHQQLPFATLVRELRPQRISGESPFFQVMLTSQPTATAGSRQFSGLTISPVDADNQLAAFDLTLQLTEEADGLRGRFHYRTAVFTASFIRRLWEQLQLVFDQMTRTPSRGLSEVTLLTEQERHEVVEVLQGERADYGAGELLQEVFARRCAETPQAVAVSAERVLSYLELDRCSNQLAHDLRARGVGLETRVGICLERSWRLVVGILGILKCGAAYVPLDPVYPRERLEYMSRDSGLRLVVSESGLAAILPQGPEALFLDEQESRLSQQRDEALPSTAHPENAAYVIYTSGSTGQPKGVVVSHRAVWRLFAATAGEYGFGPQDVWTLFHSYAFDVSVWEIWGALLHGGRLVVVPYCVSRASDELYELLKRERVTVLCQTPTAFGELMRVDAQLADRLSLRVVIFAGEALDPSRLRSWFERHGDQTPRLVNMYGITETTVHVTYRELHVADAEQGSRSPVGKPMRDLRVYLLDGMGNPVPRAVTGELYVGGAGLARGYLERPQLTAERFLPDPFSAQPGARMYRSGDLARWTDSGELEFLGRADQQVKIRGFRVELAEIEATLLSHTAVQQAAVIMISHPDRGNSLAAYVVPNPVSAGAVKRLSGLLDEHVVDENEILTLPNGYPVVFLNRAETEFLYREIFAEDTYEVALADDAVVVDVGAHIGLFALRVASKSKPRQIYAFEPMPKPYAALRANCEIHGIPAQLFQCAVGGEDKTAQFTYYPHVTVLSGQHATSSEDRLTVRRYIEAGNGAVEGIDDVLDEWMAGETIECRMTTLSTFIDENALQVIDLLKIDVEKSELEVLRGIRADHWPIVREVVVEVHDIDNRVQEITRLLTAAELEVSAYRASDLQDTGLVTLHGRRIGGKGNSVAGAGGPEIARWRSSEVLREDISSHLRRTLPDYMVPTDLTFLDHLPLTANGKLDRNSLARRPPRAARAKGERLRPRTAVEEIVADVWSAVLKRTDFGTNERFVDLGGHSLLATQIIFRLRKAFDVALPIRTMFERPTIVEQAAAIEQLIVEDVVAKDPAGQKLQS